MQPDMETTGTQVKHGWQDKDGFVGPIQPGIGPRSDPKGEFPTGPAVNTPMPDVHSLTADGDSFDLHQHRAGKPAVFIFYRSAVW